MTTLFVYPIIKDGEQCWIVDDDEGQELGFGISISHAMRMAAVNLEIMIDESSAAEHSVSKEK